MLFTKIRSLPDPPYNYLIWRKLDRYLRKEKVINRDTLA